MTAPPVPMQISVSTPAPQMPWWLASVPPASLTPSTFPIPSASSPQFYPNTASYPPPSYPPMGQQPLSAIPTGMPPLDSSLHSHTMDTQHPSSSPVHSNRLLASEHLAIFICWFKKTFAGVGSSEGEGHEDFEELIGQITHAHTTLKKEMYDLEGIRKMDWEGWKELQIPVGLGKRMSRAVREFEKVQL